MKKLIPCALCGVLIGGGAVFGVSQIPSVNNALYKNVQSQQVSELENTNSKNEQTIKNLDLEIEDYKNQIVLKDESIATHLATIEELTAVNTQLLAIKEKLETVDIPNLTNENIALNQENAELKQELDTYKELVGSDVNYLDIINNLQKELESTTTSLTTANAELEQLRTDKLVLETRVSELETELAQVKEELKGYKDSENIDKLNVANYKGTWYLNGTFEDYFNIDETGVVIHNANEDSGRVMNLYNQMYLYMNNGGSTAVTLADDGNSFTTADGQVYSRFYINKIETCVNDIYYIAGEYSYSNELLRLKIDNTLEFEVDNVVYYGAYTYTAQKKNIGGNITITSYITATINLESEVITKNLSIENGSIDLIDLDRDIVYSNLEMYSGAVLCGSATTDTDSYVESVTDGYKLLVKTDDYVTIQPGASCTVVISGKTYSNCYYSLNGVGATSTSLSFYNSTSEVIKTKYFVFYFENKTNGTATFSAISSIYGKSSSIIAVEQIGLGSVYGSGTYISRLSSELEDLLNNTQQEFNSVLINPIESYVNGIYSNSDLQVELTLENAILSIEDEEISVTSYEIEATTNGYSISHIMTITYTTTELIDEVETEVEHTLVLELENNSLLNSQLDSEDIELIKN